MRESSPYAGQTVRLKPGATEFGGLEIDVEDWYSNVDGRTWRQADADGDPKAQAYQVRRAGLPDDDEVLIGRVDGIRRIVHLTELAGDKPATFPTPPAGRVGPQLTHEEAVGLPCPGCGEELKRGDFVAQIVLGPGKDPAARKAARDGQPFQAVVEELHWACATGQEEATVPLETIADLAAAKGLPDSMLP